MVLQLLRADTVLEYWQAALAPRTPVVSFEGRAWGRARCNTGQQSREEMKKGSSIVLNFSDKANNDKVATIGKTGTY